MTNEEAILNLRQLLVTNNQYSHQLSDTLKNLASESIGHLESELNKSATSAAPADPVQEAVPVDPAE